MKKYKYLSSKEKKEIIKKHFEKRISQTQLALEYNVSRPQVSKVCREVGDSPLNKNYTLDNEKIVNLYVNGKKSVLQISKMMGLSTRPIRRRLKIEGISKKISQRDKWQTEIPHYFLKLRIWTAKIIDRDKMKCKWCLCENSHKNRLEAHHIIPVRDIVVPDLLFEMTNGITLCRKCHMKVHFHEKEYEIFFRNLIKTTSFEDK